MTAASRLLALDTATTTAVVALGDGEGNLLDVRVWQAGYRHGEELLAHVDELLTSAGMVVDTLDAVVVGTGPGAFTGLRVGLATAKGLAFGLGRPLVGVPTATALLAAVNGGEGSASALLLPAGPADRVLVHDGTVILLPGGSEPDLPMGTALVAVDLGDRAPPEASERGRRAVDGLAAALVRIGARRLAAGDVDDVARLVPEYATLPRGVRTVAGEVAWSRDRR